MQRCYFQIVGDTIVFIGEDNDAANTTKHNITDTYRLHIYDVDFSDEGLYRCYMFDNPEYDAYLTVVGMSRSHLSLFDNYVCIYQDI